MPMCHKNAHNWTSKDDSDKCCRPEWERVIVFGKDVAQSGVRRSPELLPGGVPYGYMWKPVVKT